MRILLDENLDWRLGRELIGHMVDSVPRIGWAGTKNGELLKKAAEAAYEVFITMDKGIYFQQNINHLPMAVVALKAASNRLADTRILVPELLALLPSAAAGTFYSIPRTH